MTVRLECRPRGCWIGVRWRDSGHWCLCCPEAHMTPLRRHLYLGLLPGWVLHISWRREE